MLLGRDASSLHERSFGGVRSSLPPNFARFFLFFVRSISTVRPVHHCASFLFPLFLLYAGVCDRCEASERATAKQRHRRTGKQKQNKTKYRQHGGCPHFANLVKTAEKKTKRKQEGANDTVINGTPGRAARTQRNKNNKERKERKLLVLVPQRLPPEKWPRFEKPPGLRRDHTCLSKRTSEQSYA